MSRRALLCLCLVIFLTNTAFAKEYRSTHFVIQSNLDSLSDFVKIVQENAEAFYNNITKKYSLAGWKKPLTIYYSQTESDTNKLLAMHGYSGQAGTSYFISDSPAVYAHQLTNEGKLTDWDLLFYGITRHLIAYNFRMAPEWLSEGLSTFLSQQAKVVKGNLLISGPKPWENFELRDKIETSRLNIEVLYDLSSDQFHKSPYHRHFAREFFYWLHKTNKLIPYLKNVRRYGYDFRVLTNTIFKNLSEINRELNDFLKQNCKAEAYLSEALNTDESAKKKENFLKALELKPDYHKARLGLVKCSYKSKDYKKCQENLQQLLSAPESPQYMQAAVLMGNLYYSQKDYSKALEYYNKAWEYSKNHVYRYRIAYRIGNCHYYLKVPIAAKQWYQMFLSYKWNSDDMNPCTDYAQRYVNRAAPKNYRKNKVGEDTKTTNEHTQ